MRSVFDIAGWFVEKEAMNHEKLQCMVYLSYAWFWALNEKVLFETNGFEALPVLPSEMELFQKYHTYGNKKIRYIKHEVLDKDITLFLESVYEIYKIADGEGLSSYLRLSSPYLNARKNKSKILREDMKLFYESQQNRTN